MNLFPLFLVFYFPDPLLYFRGSLSVPKHVVPKQLMIRLSKLKLLAIHTFKNKLNDGIFDISKTANCEFLQSFLQKVPIFFKV